MGQSHRYCNNIDPFAIIGPWNTSKSLFSGKKNYMQKNFEDRFIVEEQEACLRIDKLLSDRFDDKSRSYFQYLIEKGFVLLNGQTVKKRIQPKTGDAIEIFFQLPPEIELTPEPIKLDIIYEDEHLLVINKPPTMVVHPAPGNWSKTFVNALLFHCKQIEWDQDDLRPGIVHRLDKETSGLLLAAKTRKAHQMLISSFSERQVQKKYLAICVGKPKSKLIESPIGRHPVKRKEMTITPNGKQAISKVSVLAFNEKLSLNLIQPLTGRTHQIRVHLKFENAPVLGDKVYGNPASNQTYKAERQYLHAYRIRFKHPIKNEWMDLMAPLPQDMKQFISKLLIPNFKS